MNLTNLTYRNFSDKPWGHVTYDYTFAPTVAIEHIDVTIKVDFAEDESKSVMNGIK